MRGIILILLPACAALAQRNPSTWTLIGPRPTTNVIGANPTSGRVSALVVDPRNNNVVYLGAASGGVWKTTDGGSNWTPLTDGLDGAFAIGALAIDPSNPDTIYAGTGEETFSPGSYYGSGILVSNDAGAHWRPLPPSPFMGPFDATFQGGGARIGSFAVDPSNPRVLLAATYSTSAGPNGILRSTDGGQTWSTVISGAPGTEVLFHPTNGSIAYAATGDPAGNSNNGIFKSTDAGQTWSFTGPNPPGTSVPANVGRIRLAIAPSNPAILYASIQDATSDVNTALGVWKSTNGGNSWSQLPNVPDFCRDSCNYHMVVRVNPRNANIVVVGGLTPYRSLDGGSSWKDIEDDRNGLRIHGDQHALAFTPDGSKLYVGNDGGAYSTIDLTSTPNTWTPLNGTLAITQFYPGLSIPPANVNAGYGGTQDNGVQKYSGTTTWTGVACGDGGRTLIDPATPSTVYVSCLEGTLNKSLDAGGSFQDASNGIIPERHEFVAPLQMDPSNSLRLYYGTFRVYQTTDGAAHWRPISPDLTVPGQIVGISALALAPSDPNTIYAASGNDGISKMFVTANALAGPGSTWTDRTGALPPRFPTAIAVDPRDARTAFVAFAGFSSFHGDTQGHVFVTHDRGVTWNDVSGNLPNLPVNDLLCDPDLPNVVYAATDSGVWETAGGGNAWFQPGAGLPRVPVRGLAFHRPTRTLRAGTYGRSVWDLLAPLPTPAVNNGGSVNDAFPLSTNGVAPGSIVSVYGTSLALCTQSGGTPLPLSLCGMSMTMGGFGVPLFFASPDQVNIQVPWELEGSSSTQLVVNVAGIASQPSTVRLARTAPGIFTLNQQGTGQGAVLISGTARLAAPAGLVPGSQPVARGQFIEIYATGLGRVTNRPQDGGLSPPPPLLAETPPPAVTIGGQTVTAAFSGLAPGFVGLYQVNVQVPANAQIGGNVSLSMTIDGVSSNTVTIAVQ